MRKKIITALLAIILLELIILATTFISPPRAQDQAHPTLQKNEVLVDSSQLNVNKIDESEIIKRNKQLPDSSSWKESEDEIKFPIIAYSYLEQEQQEDTDKLTIAQLEEQLKWFKDNDYYTLTPQEALEVLTTNKKPADKIVWLTFDNGYYTQYKYAYPLLQQYNMQATINYLPEKQDNITYANIHDAQEMVVNGEINIESGTLNGESLISQKEIDSKKQLTQSKKTLDDSLKQETSTIAYPKNDYNEAIIESAKQAGYSLGLTTNKGLASKSDGLLTLDRIEITKGMALDAFAKLVEQTY